MEILHFALPNIGFRGRINSALVLSEPKEIRGISPCGIFGVLEFVVDDSWAVFTATEHWMGPSFQVICPYRFVWYKKELICPSDDAHIYLGNVVEAMYRW